MWWVIKCVTGLGEGDGLENRIFFCSFVKYILIIKYGNTLFNLRMPLKDPSKPIGEVSSRQFSFVHFSLPNVLRYVYRTYYT